MRFADKTRQALAFEQLRTQRTPIIVYAGSCFAIFETLSFAPFILQLPATAQDRLRHWLDAHLQHDQFPYFVKTLSSCIRKSRNSVCNSLFFCDRRIIYIHKAVQIVQ
jgi:hypothetical protein